SRLQLSIAQGFGACASYVKNQVRHAKTGSNSDFLSSPHTRANSARARHARYLGFGFGAFLWCYDKGHQPGRQAQHVSISRRFCVSTFATGTCQLEVANCDFKSRAWWSTKAPVGLYGAWCRNAVERPEIAYRNSGQYRGNPCLCPRPPSARYS